MSIKYNKVPTFLTQSSSSYGLLKVKDFLAIASYEQTHHSSGRMLLEEHLLLFVLEGTNTLTHGKEKYVVHKNQMILLPKATIWEYEKKGTPHRNNIYDSMLFFLKDEFLKDFIQMGQIKAMNQKKPFSASVKPVNKHLKAYLNSIKPYFDNYESIDSGLLRLKMIELLYNISMIDDGLLTQIIQLKQPVKTNIVSVIEQNYTNHISLSELAYLSGRSLSGFKRDFTAIYNTHPSKWIREKRLVKSKELLSGTSLSIAEICYISGFENATHFSRIFKDKYGLSPSDERKANISIESNRNNN